MIQSLLRSWDRRYGESQEFEEPPRVMALIFFVINQEDAYFGCLPRDLGGDGIL
jgi:hypothetical protein